MSTKPCPQCGTAVSLQARFCGKCGHTLSTGVPKTVDEATQDPPPSRAKLGATMIGHAPIAPAHLAARAPAPAPAPTPAPAFGKTMVLGGTAEAPVPGPAGAPAGFPGAKQTMLGMPSTGLVGAPPAPAPAPPAPAALAPLQRTMLGVALPGIAPTEHKPQAPPAPAPPDGAGTLLGIAAPGIAPLQPGVTRAPVQAGTPSLPPTPPPIVPAPPPLVDEPLPALPRRPAKKGVPAVALVGILFAVVVAAGVVAVLLLRSGSPLAAQPQLDENGRESLRIRCDSCPDGTIVSLGASSSKVEHGATLLPLPAPLSIGDNDLEMKLDRPPPGRDETVKVHVPVAYRVKADLTTLTADPATVTVRVEAVPGTEVTVDGKPVALDASGRGAHALDVSADVQGPSDDARTIDRKIPFTIKVKGTAAPESRELVVRAGITPLHLDAPGTELFTDRATGNVAGQVKPGATVTIDGQNVAVNERGRFGVRVELPAEGDKTLTIVASAPPLAPRTVRAKLVRAGSADAAVSTLDARSPLLFAAYGADPKSKLGQLAVVEGELQEIRIAQGYTLMFVEDKACTTASGGPASCVARVAHGEEVRASRGDTVRAYGRLVGTTAMNGKSIPDLEGVLVVPRGSTKK